LRREGNGYRIIGEAHVQGLMNGEILEELLSGQAKLEGIRIVWVWGPLMDSACDRPPKDTKDKNMGVVGPTKPWSLPVPR
jgi:hypothetical protein